LRNMQRHFTTEPYSTELGSMKVLAVHRLDGVEELFF
jgi:hypothetical protein